MSERIFILDIILLRFNMTKHPTFTQITLNNPQDYLLLGEDLKDIKMQGQACGCLGNVYYLLGNYSKALFYYRKRLLLAQKNSDQVAERRAYK